LDIWEKEARMLCQTHLESRTLKNVFLKQSHTRFDVNV
jgi:hypothetical protein